MSGFLDGIRALGRKGLREPALQALCDEYFGANRLSQLRGHYR